MLVLARGEDEGLVALLDEATLKLLLQEVRRSGNPVLFRYGPVKIQSTKVRIGTHAPQVIAVDRDEVFAEKHGEITPFGQLHIA